MKARIEEHEVPYQTLAKYGLTREMMVHQRFRTAKVAFTGKTDCKTIRIIET